MQGMTTPGELLEHWKAAGRPRRVVFTNGCFDLLHPGHTRYLTAARELGDCLVVGLNDDAGVRRLKGKNRPFVSAPLRGEVLAALEAVDFVVPFGEDTPLALIKALRPDVLVKGGDYTAEQIVGAAEVESRGGRVVVLPLEADFSTTALAIVVAEGVAGDLGWRVEHVPYGPGMGERAAAIKEGRERIIKGQAGRKES